MPLYLVCTGTVSKVEKKKMEKKQRKAQLKAQSKAMEEKKGSGHHMAHKPHVGYVLLMCAPKLLHYRARQGE